MCPLWDDLSCHPPVILLSSYTAPLETNSIHLFTLCSTSSKPKVTVSRGEGCRPSHSQQQKRTVFLGEGLERQKCLGKGKKQISELGNSFLPQGHTIDFCTIGEYHIILRDELAYTSTAQHPFSCLLTVERDTWKTF